MQTLGIGLLIMLARMSDVTIGTLRVISVIDGRMKTSFLLGFVEVVIWLSVISLTLTRIEENPWLGLFFALGFSMGNVLGILVERRIPLGNLTLRAVGGDEVRDLAGALHEEGLRTTLLRGEGRTGEKNMLFCFMPKRALSRVMPHLKPLRERIFYTLDYGGTSNQVLMPRTQSPPSRRRSPMRK
ncbi:DUF5698 domain-containing protein [Haloferula sargassicola]